MKTMLHTDSFFLVWNNCWYYLTFNENHAAYDSFFWYGIIISPLLMKTMLHTIAFFWYGIIISPLLMKTMLHNNYDNENKVAFFGME